MSRPVRHPSALNPVIVGMRSGSDELPALERALELATQRHTHLVVVHVFPRHPASPSPSRPLRGRSRSPARSWQIAVTSTASSPSPVPTWTGASRSAPATQRPRSPTPRTATGQPVSSSADTTTRRPSAGSAARRSASRKPAIVRSWSCRFATRGPRRSTSPTTTRKLGRVVQPGGARGSGPRHK